MAQAKRQEMESVGEKQIGYKYAILIAAAGVAVTLFLGLLAHFSKSTDLDHKSDYSIKGSFNTENKSETTINNFPGPLNPLLSGTPQEIPAQPYSKQPTQSSPPVQLAPLRNVQALNQKPVAASQIALTTATPKAESLFAFERDAVLLNYYKRLDDLRVDGAEIARKVSSFDRCEQEYRMWEPKGSEVLREINGYLKQGYNKRVFLDQDFGTQDMSVFYSLSESERLKYCRDIFYTRARILGGFDGMIKNALLMD